MRFEHVLVVGAGQMGGGIAQVMAASGRRVSLHDAAPGAVERGLETMRRSLGKLAEKGASSPDEVIGQVEPVGDLVPADLMVEAVVEDAAVKEEVFRRADETLPAEAVLASNTSSIPISSLAAATGRFDAMLHAWRTDDTHAPSGESLRPVAQTMEKAGNKKSAKRVLEFVYQSAIDKHELSQAYMLGLAEIRGGRHVFCSLWSGQRGPNLDCGHPLLSV